MRWRLNETYIIRAIAPYMALATLLLTAALLAQQAGKFAELLAGAQAPFIIAGRILAGLIPNILVFTLPMATLLGVIVGFSRLSSDSELTAMRAAGMSARQLNAPALLVGTLISGVTFVIAFQIAPSAAHMLREEALSVALYKLQTPIEPRTFNTDFPGKVIYVRDGDEKRGEWGRVFIYSQEGAETVSLYTARNGRIDTTAARSELVLSDVSMITLQDRLKDGATGESVGERKSGGEDKLTRDHSAQLRVRLNTNRDDLISKARARQIELDELNWRELTARAKNSDPSIRRAAHTAFHKRLALCAAPCVFALLGSALGALTRRGGRGAGILLGLAALLVYYLVALAGEQMARAGSLPPYACWAGVAVAFIGAVFAQQFNGDGSRFLYGIFQRFPAREASVEHETVDHGKSRGAYQGRMFRAWTPAGLLDRQVMRGLAGNFVLALSGLIGLVLIFTLFELLRYIAMTGDGLKLIGRYLFFLTPMVGVAVSPIAMLVACLATYSVLVRRSEAVAWLAAGQSLYRLTLPSFLFALVLCGGIWMTQEKIVPASNRIQDALRQKIRGDAARAVASNGSQWLATNDGHRLYMFDHTESAKTSEDSSSAEIRHPVLFEFDDEGVFLKRIVRGESGAWVNNDQLLRFAGARTLELRQGQITRAIQPELELKALTERPDDFKQMFNAASHLDSQRLREAVVLLKRRGAGADANFYMVALQRRFADLLAPFVMTLISIPLAFTFGRRGTLVALTAAVLVGLGFWGASSGFNQLGLYQMVTPALAAWASPLIFGAIGVYLLARLRT